MRIRNDPAQRPAPHLDRWPLARFEAALAQHQIEIAGLESGREFTGGGARHFHRRARMGRREASENVGEAAARETFIDAEPDDLVRFLVLNRTNNLIVEREQLAAPRDQLLVMGVSSTPPPLERAMRVWPTRASSLWTCNETADWVRPTRSAARVKLFSSAISTRVRTRSISSAGVAAMDENRK